MRVPEGWKRTTLDNYITIKHGFAFKSDFFTNDGQYVLMTPGSFFESGGFRDQGVKTKYYVGDFPSGYLLKKDDLVIVMTEQAEGLLGSAALIPENNKYLHNQRLGLVKIIEKERISIKFLYCLYNFRYVRKQISEQSAGTKVKHTSPDKLIGVTALIPTISEQEKIAQILSTWDKAIEKLDALITVKQKRKKALMQRLLTGKKRFLGFEGEWKEIRLKKFINEEKARNKDVLVSRVLSVTNHSGFVLPEEQFSRQVASSDLSNYKIVRKGQFGYNPSRINVGSFARLDAYSEGVLSPMYIVFSIDEKRMDTNFFLNWMDSHEAKQRILSSTQGSVRDSVGFDALSSFLIKLPSIDEQQKIASVLTTADKEIENHQKQLSALKEQKKALMQQLLTGKKRVKVNSHV